SVLGQREKWTSRADYRRRTIDIALSGGVECHSHPEPNGQAANEDATEHHPDTNNQTGSDKAASPPFSVQLHDLTLTVISASTTPSGKLSASVSIVKNGERIDEFTLTTSPSSKKAAREAVALHLDSPNRREIDQALGKLIILARQKAQEPRAAPTGNIIREILREKVPPCFDLAFRCTRGAWSNRRGEEVTSALFTTSTRDWLRGACEQAIDCPRRAGEVNRLLLGKLVKFELGVVWSTTLQTLPTEEAANSSPTSPAARRFHRMMIEVFSDLIQFEVEKSAVGTPAATVYAARTSIIERIREAAVPCTPGNTQPGKRVPWRRVQKTDVWWKPTLVGNKVRIMIAARWRIGFQTKKVLPGVHDQESFRRQCEKSGLARKGKRGSSRRSGG